MAGERSSSEEQSNLGKISTHWSAVRDAGRFVVRYAVAIRKLLAALLHNPQDEDDVLQEFLLGVTQTGFRQADATRGRFRDYLFISVRNAARKHLQRKQAHQRREAPLPEDVAGPPALDAGWLAEWQGCLLERALAALYRHQRQSPNNLAHTVLAARLEFPEADSAALAAETSRRCGREVSAEAYRQHLLRARRLFARFLLTEVVETLEAPTPEQIEEELSALGLLEHVKPYLPADGN
jgi:RNA polymerase sigma-70 factor (ECF subfamily)